MNEGRTGGQVRIHACTRIANPKECCWNHVADECNVRCPKREHLGGSIKTRRRPESLLSAAHNFLFIHVPKTGGNSVQRVLLPFSDDRMALVTPLQDGIERFEIRSPKLDIHKHSGLEDYRRQLDAETFSRLTKITCIRNPWDRCVSYFFSPHRGEVTWSADAFENFIETEVKPHRDYLTLEGQVGDAFDNVDIVLRFENLEKDFAGLCDQLGIGRLELPHVNASRRGDYRTCYTTDRVIDLVAEKFAAEIALFDYQF